MDNVLHNFEKNTIKPGILASCPRCHASGTSVYARKKTPNRRCKICGCEFNARSN